VFPQSLGVFVLSNPLAWRC